MKIIVFNPTKNDIDFQPYTPFGFLILNIQGIRNNFSKSYLGRHLHVNRSSQNENTVIVRLNI